MKKKLLLLSICFLSQSLFAQLDTAKLNLLFANYDAYQKAMLSMTFSEKGKTVYKKSIGYADVTEKRKANETTLYHIGSITKMFTSVMVFQLIDEKKLSLDTKLKTFFPSLPNSEKITIGNMLNHRSGLHNFTDDAEYSSYNEKPISQKELLAKFAKQASDFEPGSKGEYSNTNYVVLSFIIEKITGDTYTKELQKRICEKIGLKHTKVAQAINTAANEAQSYTFENNNWKQSTQTDMSVPCGAGAIESTPEDLCRFIEALFAGKLMSETSFNTMKIIQENYGSGILQFPFGTKKAYGHNGGIDGFQSTLGYFPEDKVAFCILGNAWNYPMNDVAIAILSIYFNKPFSIPSFEKKIITGDAAKTLAGTYGNSSINMKITVKQDGENITAQANGQSAFPLEKVSELEYKFDTAGIRMLFKKDEDGNILSFTLKQGGMDLNFEKE